MKNLTPRMLNEITQRIVNAVHPEKIILFGSHAWGVPTIDSDVDLFVILPFSNKPSYRRATEIYRNIRGIGVPVDLVVQTHEEVEKGKKVVTSLVRKVLEEGRILHG